MSGNSKTAIMTASGRFFDPMAPRVEDVNLHDIALALGRIPRFNGHTKRVITVAEHSLRVARFAVRIAASRGMGEHARRVVELLALLHDAAEAYLGDIVRPLKTRAHREIEAGVQAVILDAFTGHAMLDLIDEDAAWSAVHDADNIALYFEAMLWQHGAQEWAPALLDGLDVGDPLGFLPLVVAREPCRWIDAVHRAIGDASRAL